MGDNMMVNRSYRISIADVAGREVFTSNLSVVNRLCEVRGRGGNSEILTVKDFDALRELARKEGIGDFEKEMAGLGIGQNQAVVTKELAEAIEISANDSFPRYLLRPLTEKESEQYLAVEGADLNSGKLQRAARKKGVTVRLASGVNVLRASRRDDADTPMQEMDLENNSFVL